jgi:trigger factor
VRPEIPLPDLSTVEVTVDEIEVTDAEVDEQVDELRQRFGTLKPVERPVQAGDFVSLDLAARIDGEEVEGGSASGLTYEVGKDDLVAGLDEAITGISAGQSVTFATTLRQGDKAEVAVTVNSVKEKELPPADEEFAQMASEFDTLDELRADLRERVRRAKQLGQGSQARDRVLEQLIDTADFPVPDSAIEAETGAREHDIVHSLGHDDALFDQFLTGQGKTREAFTAELREAAERSVKAQFVLDAIADAEQVSVDDAELTEYLVRQAARYQMPPKEFADRIVQAGNLPSLLADVRRSKALATVLEAVTVTDTAGNPVDLSALSPTLAVESSAELGDEELGVEEPSADNR